MVILFVAAMQWAVHDTLRPLPRVVEPASAASTGKAPSDAIVLFDGKNLSSWRSARDTTKPAAWKLVGEAFEVVPKTGDIVTARAFGDVQLHLEWLPPPREGKGQGMGNSGVFLMKHYEVQILDSYQNRTYADGQAGAIYGQTPPLVNAMRPPGEWQVYDIVFRRPVFDASGSVVRPARVTVLHNGVLIQDNVALTGRTVHAAIASYKPHADRLPIQLQDHSNAMRFRNIWVRELEP
jgi:hypothetical protein